MFKTAKRRKFVLVVFYITAVLVLLHIFPPYPWFEDTNVMTPQTRFEDTNVMTFKRRNISRPNILFILADDLGFNDIGYHGSEIKTPNLDKLAMSGVRLENYYVQPICTPTRSQLLTGRYQIHTGLQHGIIWNTEPSSIPLDSKTIADKMSDAGYSTHLVGKWHLGYYKRKFLPTRRGFHSFFGFLNGHNGYYSYISLYKAYKGYDLRENEAPARIRKYSGKYSTHVFTDRVIDIFKRGKNGKPLFVYLSFQAPHSPLQVPQAYLSQYKHMKLEPRRRLYAVDNMADAVASNIKAVIVLFIPFYKILLANRLDEDNHFKYTAITVPLYISLLTLVLLSFGAKGGNQWWFGIRKDFCQFSLGLCPCLQEYGNISYSAQRSSEPVPETDHVTPKHLQTKKKPPDESQKVVMPIVSIETPD